MNVYEAIDRTPIGYEPMRAQAILAAGLGIMCEFGVHNGRYMKEMAPLTPTKQWYGFDSFKGMPEDWGPALKKGELACDPPTDLPPNVELVIGLFQDTLEDFIAKHQQPFSFIHFDADLYSSTKFVLRAIDGWVDGTFMMFDQIFDQVPGETYRWEHEGHAFQEWLDETGHRCEIYGRQKRDGAIFRVW